MSGALVTNTERNVLLYRAFTPTPTESIFNKVQFGTGTTDPGVTDSGLASSTGSTRDLTITVDETNFEITLQGKLVAGDGVGQTISEVMTFNTDSTPLGGTRGVWSGNAKTGSSEYRVKIKTRIREVLV